MGVQLTSIEFNHDPNSDRNDAINIRKDANEMITVPEWRRGLSLVPSDSLAAYALEPTRGRTLTIRASFVRTDPALRSVQVRAIPVMTTNFPEWYPLFLLQQYLATPFFYYPYSLYLFILAYAQYVNDLVTSPVSNVLGSVAARTVNFQANGQSGPTLFELENVRLWDLGAGIHTLTWQWQWRLDTNSFWIDLEKTSHKIYSLLSVPNLPWEQLPYRADNTQLPWTDVMEFSCGWALGTTSIEEAGSRVTQNIFAMGPVTMEYDCPGGGVSHYTNVFLTAQGLRNFFNCTAFLELLGGEVGNGRYVNCTDCATFVSTFANVLGCDLWQSRMQPPNDSAAFFFPTNQMVAIGSLQFSQPCGFWPGFAYHEVAWTDRCTSADQVYDACLGVNGGPHPATAPRRFLLPADMLFGLPGDGQYRDRLASPGGRELCEPRPTTRVRRIVF